MDRVSEDILDAAERCFEHDGVARTTMRLVAGEAGISRTTLYKRHGSIDDVLRAVFVREFDRFEHRLRPRIDRLADPVERLVEIMVATAENVPDNTGIARLVEGQRTRAEARALQVGRSALDQRVAALIGEPLDELAADGRLATALDRAELLEWIRRIVTSLVIVPQRSRRSAADRRRHVAALVAPFLTATSPEGALAHAR